MSYEITGKVIMLKPRQEFSGGSYKQEIVVIGGTDKYPQHIPIEFWKDKVDKLAGVNVGDTVTIKFDLRGREYCGKHYLNANGWSITVDLAVAADDVADVTDEQSDADTESLPF